MSSFSKDILRSIRGSLGRFLAIAAIAALGVGFFAGLRMAEPDMLLTADSYYDDSDLMDVRIVSTLGLSDEDVDALASLEGVDQVMPARETDVLAEVGEGQYALRVHSIESEDGDASKQPLNKLVLDEGRWPESANECVMLCDAVLPESVELGDTVNAVDCIANLDDTLAQTQLTVVGFVHDPYYTCSSNLGTTSIGGSVIEQVIYVLPDAFDEDLPYTQAFLTVKGAADEMWGSDAYNQKVDAVLASIKEKQPEWEANRTEQVKREAQEKIDEAQSELDSERANAQSQLDSAKAQLDSSAAALASGQAQIESGQEQLAAGQSQLETSREEAEAALAQAESQIDQLEQSQAQVADAQAQLDAAWAAAGMSYDQALALPSTAAQIELQMNAPGISYEERQALMAQLDQVNSAIAATQPLIAQQDAVNQSRAQVDAAISQFGSIEAARQQIADQRATLETEMANAQSELDGAKSQLDSSAAQLESGRAQYASGLSAYESSSAEAQQKLDDAQAQIDDAKADIDDIEDASWYVLDRSKTYGCESFRSDANRIGNIAAVFPLIFFLVAALVALTTMTRMVEEERILIGTYKALGYSRAKITAKYLVYASLATLLGSVLGILLLAKILPFVVQYAYSIIYYFPELMTPINVPIALYAGGLGFAVILLSTLAAAVATLREKPAELMLPRAPKPGKRIFLERIPFIWKRVSFSWKVTFRNLLRYKKRFFMTVIGIAGCTALLLTGLGLNNSINDIIERQYGPVIKYDTVITCTDDATDESRVQVESVLESEEYAYPYHWTMSVDLLAAPVDAPQIGCSVVVTDDGEGLNEFVDLHTRIGQDPLQLTDEGAIVTEKIANLMGVGVGDSIVLNEQDDSGTMTSVTHEIPIAGIAENYTGHYVYITPSLYETIWGEEVAFNSLLVNGADDAEQRSDFSQEIRSIDGVSTVAFNKEVVDTYKEMLTSVNMVVVVLVLAAMALAFIVLYNLTNINIMERQREIATLKVLGFMPREVSAYIFRETIILSIIGALVGLVLGVGMESFVVITAEVEMVMFGRVIHASSFVLAFALTLVFTVIITLFMRRRLAKVDMVESLKSIE